MGDASVVGTIDCCCLVASTLLQISFPQDAGDPPLPLAFTLIMAASLLYPPDPRTYEGSMLLLKGPPSTEPLSLRAFESTLTQVILISSAPVVIWCIVVTASPLSQRPRQFVPQVTFRFVLQALYPIAAQQTSARPPSLYHRRSHPPQRLRVA